MGRLSFRFFSLGKFLVNMCYSYFIGFTIPQLLGAASGDSIVEQVFRLKMICTVCVVLYGGFLFYVGGTENQEIKASVPLPFTDYTFNFFSFISLVKGNL